MRHKEDALHYVSGACSRIEEPGRYASLGGVLDEAFERACNGKGAQRHCRGNEPFEEQYILRGARSYGIGGLYFQLGKKLEESFAMSGEAREKELIDIINYAAAAVIRSREDKARET